MTFNTIKKMAATVAISAGIFAAFGFNSFAADNTETDAPKYGVIEKTEAGNYIGCDSLYNDMYEDGGALDDFEAEIIEDTTENTTENTTDTTVEDTTEDAE